MEFRRVLFRSAKTLEVLESLGVPVIGYGCDELPALYSRSSGLAAPLRRDSAAGIAAVMAPQWDLEPGGARESVVTGKSVSVQIDVGCRRITRKNNTHVSTPSIYALDTNK